MSPQNRAKDVAPTWEDVRDEAGQLTREVMHQSLVWTRRAFNLATNLAEMTAKAAEEATEKAEETFKKVRNR
jgi:predicted translin family RNA/ssDNA-binding protein